MKGHVQTFVLTRNAWTEGIDPVTCKQDFAHCFKTQKESATPQFIVQVEQREKSPSSFIHFKAFISGDWEKKIISKANRLD